MRLWVAAVGSAAIALSAPAAAGASVYCVGTSGGDCNNSAYPATGDGLQQALTDADNGVDIDGGGDTVRIGPGTYERTNGANFVTAGGDITVEGAGQSTVLTTDAADGRTVLTTKLGGTGGVVRNLRLQLMGDTSGIYGFDQVSDVRVTGPGAAAAGISADNGGRISRVVIDPAGGISGEGIEALSSVTIDDAVVLMRSTSKGASAVALFNDNTGADVNSAVRHLTVLGDGRAGTSGVEARAFGGASGPGTLNAVVRDSVIRNVGAPLLRTGEGSMTKPGVSNVAFRYSSLDANKNLGTGPGSFTPGPGNLPDPDPLFAADLSPSPGSPLIDAGDPAGPEAGDSPSDVAGNPRIAGGRRDIGAFETRFPQPTTTGRPGGLPAVTTASASALGVSPKAFRAAGSGPGVSAARRAPVGAIVSYVLNVDASVRFTVRRALRGRRVVKGRKARCVKPTARNRRARSCKRLKTRGSFSQAGRAGRNSFHFRGRLRGKKLKPGRYVLVARPAGGTASRTPFRIVR